MIFILMRADGVVEIRDQADAIAGAIVVDDALMASIRQAVSSGKLLSIVNGAVVFLDPPAPTAEELAAEAAIARNLSDALAAKQYAKLVALMNMTPAQVLAFIQSNVTNLATAQDALATLAVAVGVLARRL